MAGLGCIAIHTGEAFKHKIKRVKGGENDAWSFLYLKNNPPKCETQTVLHCALRP